MKYKAVHSICDHLKSLTVVVQYSTAVVVLQQLDFVQYLPLGLRIHFGDTTAASILHITPRMNPRCRAHREHLDHSFRRCRTHRARFGY